VGARKEKHAFEKQNSMTTAPRKKTITDLMGAELSQGQFQRVSQLVHSKCGIKLRSGKEALVRSRLMKRLRALGMSSFKEYFRYLEEDGSGRELGCMIDVITTNKTSFFREIDHFNYLREQIIPALKGKRVRIWSAGCSSGEEPYSLAILLREELADRDLRDAKILATDISVRMLEKVRRGLYESEALRTIPPVLIQKYFVRAQNGSGYQYRVKDAIKLMVREALLNLIEPWPLKGPFNAIFCRNVMMYFDRTTQETLVNRFWELLEPGGHLFVGHSESLSAVPHKFSYVQPAVYRKPANN